MCRATTVAATVARTSGIMIEKPPWVSSMISASPASGACMAAPSMAAAPTRAYTPDPGGPR